MPELPEVETVKRGLEALLTTQSITAVSFDWPKSFPNNQADVDAFLVGAQVTAVRRRAKVLIIDLGTGYSLVIHLKMTGQLVFVQNQEAPNPKPQIANNDQGIKDQREKRLILDSHYRAGGNPVRKNEHSELAVIPAKAGTSKRLDSRSESGMTVTESETRFGAGHPNDSLVGHLPDRSTRVTFELNNGAKLFFNDQRKFGWVRLYPTVEVPNIDFMKKVGPEPLDDDFRVSDFEARLLRRKNSGIKAVLLDQTVIAGVGNIYADESLWAAKIHPETKVVDIPKSKIKNLYTELRAVLLLSIEKGGSTDKNYVNAEGKKGSYISFARVFRKEGTPCVRHPDTLIQKTRVAGRGTHICPRCQVRPE